MQTHIQVVQDAEIIIPLLECLRDVAQAKAEISFGTFNFNRQMLYNIQARILRDNMEFAQQYNLSWLNMMRIRSYFTDNFFDLDWQFRQTSFSNVADWTIRAEILRGIAINEQITCDAQAHYLEHLGHVQNASVIQRYAAAGFQLARVNELCDKYINDVKVVVDLNSAIQQFESSVGRNR